MVYRTRTIGLELSAPPTCAKLAHLRQPISTVILFYPMKSLKVIKITTFDQNQFMSCYLIFNFRPTYFSYFWKITAICISYNVKKTRGPKVVLPRSQGVKIYLIFVRFLFVSKKCKSFFLLNLSNYNPFFV